VTPADYHRAATERLMTDASTAPVTIDVDALLNQPGLDYIDRALIKAMAVIVGGAR